MYANKVPALTFKGSAQSLTSNANIANYLAMAKVLVRRVSFQVTTATVSSGGIVLTFYVRPTPGSTAGQVTLGTITIPTAIAAGTVYYNDLGETGVLLPGQELACDVTTAAAGGGAAGAGYFVPQEIEEYPDMATNFSNHVKVTA